MSKLRPGVRSLAATWPKNWWQFGTKTTQPGRRRPPVDWVEL